MSHYVRALDKFPSENIAELLKAAKGGDVPTADVVASSNTIIVYASEATVGPPSDVMKQSDQVAPALSSAQREEASKLVAAFDENEKSGRMRAAAGDPAKGAFRDWIIAAAIAALRKWLGI